MCHVVRQIETTPDGRYTLFLDKGEPVSGFDAIMFATGRSPNTHRPNLNLAAVGVDLDAAGAIKVRPTVCASSPHHTHEFIHLHSHHAVTVRVRARVKVRVRVRVEREVFQRFGQPTALARCLLSDRLLTLAGFNRIPQVDEFSRTTKPGVWAIGDVTNRVNLTPVALMEGSAFVRTALQNEDTKPDYSFIPTAVFSQVREPSAYPASHPSRIDGAAFSPQPSTLWARLKPDADRFTGWRLLHHTQPPVGTVGLGEEEAVKQGHTCDVYVASFRPMRATISGREEKCLMKLIVDVTTDKVRWVSSALSPPSRAQWPCLSKPCVCGR